MVVYRLLGALEASEDGVSADLGPPRQRALLALLLLHANELVPVDTLIDQLWGEAPPRQAQHAVQVYVSELRRALAPLAGEEVIAWRSPGYVLAADPGAIDAQRFTHLVSAGLREAHSGDPAAAAVPLREALALWHGPALSDVVYEDFAQPAIRQLDETRLRAIETLARVELALGRESEALALANSAVLLDPLREPAREVQMLALYRVGRAADALRTFEDLRRRLAEDLDTEPTPALRSLQEQVLVHDGELQARMGAGRPTSPHDRNPYKGLRPFGEEDADDFFGRDAVVERLASRLAAGARLLALVGPSGSGKSSILHAGLMPRLRAAGASGAGDQQVAPRVIALRPIDHGVDALESTLGPGGDARLLVVDQFEEVFAGDEAAVADILAGMARAVQDPDGEISIVLALRADAYDRPLLHARFAPVFLAGVENVIPMTAEEIEAAVLRPAARAGVSVEPALLAELVAETVDRPGALPLLQHALAELFDRRTGGSLTHEAYRELGGLRMALARRADATLDTMTDEGKAAARQVFLRLVSVAEGQRASARRVPLRELAGMGLDPVTLSEVLLALDRDRLVTLDRDPHGGAVVEVAHESLFTAWDRLAGWIDEERADLGHRTRLAGRAADWVAAGRPAEDLLAGPRLDELEAWRRTTTLRLTDDETAFLEASLARRDAELAARAEQAASMRRLERRARIRLAGLVGVVVLLVGAATWAVATWPGPAPGAVLVYAGSSDSGVDDSVRAGFDAAVARDDLDAQVVVEAEDGLEARLRRLAGQGVDLLVVGSPWGNPDTERAARVYPATRFLALDYHGELPNVSAPLFGNEEGAFLVGAAAALETSTGTVGVAVCDSDHGWPYAAGFQAGAHAAKPATEVLVAYLYCSSVNGLGYNNVRAATLELYRQGADVVLFAGDGSPLGAFQAAHDESEAQGRHLWAVGLDSDWYVVLPLVASARGGDAAEWRPHVLTSLITRYDLALGAMLDDYAAGTLAPGMRRFALAEGTFELAESGGFIDNVLPKLAALREQVAGGEIDVPRRPDERALP